MSKKIQQYLSFALALFLGGYMIYGGVGKFLGEAINATSVLEKANKFSAPDQVNTLQKILYISGSKQTGYFWQLLGLCELLFGLLIIIPRTRLIGAILLLPITLNILLFHIVLEPNEIGGLVLALLLFGTNVYLVLKEKRILSGLVLRPVPKVVID